MKTMNKKIYYSHLILVFISLTFVISLSAGLVSAVPGIPHQFYGSVTVNGQPAPDNNIITAFVQGDDYITITTDGRYGYSPNIFYVEDPDGDRSGELIQFFVGGKKAGSYVFENNGYTRLNFDLTTTCGDGYCLGDETCSSCQNDCGICTNPPVITIISPEQDKVYDTTKIDLKVTADQGIIVWMYSLDDTDPVTFTPNITLTLSEGNHKLTAIGLSKENYLSGSKTVSFSIDLADSTPPINGGGSSGGGGGSSGGGGSATTTSTTSAQTATVTTTQGGEETSGEETSSGIEEEDKQQTTAGITGAVVGVLGRTRTVAVAVFIVAIIIIAIYVSQKRKK